MIWEYNVAVSTYLKTKIGYYFISWRGDYVSFAWAGCYY